MKFPRVPLFLTLACVSLLAALGAGCGGRTVDGKPMNFYVQVGDSGSMSTKSRAMKMPDGMSFFVKPEPIMRERNVTNVDLVRVANGRLALLFYLDDEGTNKLYRTSVTERGRFMIFEYNGVPIGERMLEAPISDGRYFTFINLPEDEMEELVSSLRENISKIQQARASNRMN